MNLTDKNTGFEKKQVTFLALSVPIRYSKPILKNKYTHISGTVTLHGKFDP
jgi:hypothetical protein